MKIFNTHILAEQLADALDDKKPLANDLQHHLSNCSHCLQEFDRLKTVIGLMRRDDSTSAPAEALQFARNIFRARKALTPTTETLTNKILATLKLDLQAFAPVFGERSGGAVADERQMLFAVGDYDLDLRIRNTPNGFIVRGQVLGELSEKCAVRLEAADLAVVAPVDEMGAFSFSPLSSVDDMQVSLVFAE